MKLVRKYAICCAALLALISFILLLATPALTLQALGGTLEIKGTTAIFGQEYLKPIGVALGAWILLLIGLLCAICLTVLPLLKSVKIGKKVLAFFGCALAIVLLVAAILVFCTVAGYDGYSLGAGWIVSGIFLILAAIGAGCDPLFTLLGK